MYNINITIIGGDNLKKFLIVSIILLILIGFAGFFSVKYYDYRNGKTLNWVDKHLRIEKDLSFEEASNY